MPLDDWLERLGSAAPTPGGGAAAALAAATGAALIEMVVNLTIGKSAYAEHESHVQPIGAQARALRQRALELIDADAAAFDTVMAAYGLPRDSDAEKAARTAAIQVATTDAARPPMEIAEVAARIIEQAGAQLRGRALELDIDRRTPRLSVAARRDARDLPGYREVERGNRHLRAGGRRDQRRGQRRGAQGSGGTGRAAQGAVRPPYRPAARS